MILLSWRTFITVTVDVSSLSIISPTHSTHTHSHSHSHCCCRRSKTSVAAALKFPFCSLSSFQDDIPPVLQKSQLKPKKNDIDVHNENDFVVEDVGGKGKGGVGVGGGGGGQGIHGIQVPRQQYISVSKSDLLNAIISMFHSQQDIDQFLHLSSCLDSIIHAEHKGILEEMRLDYNLTHSVENEGNSSSEVLGIPNDYKESDLAVDKSIGNGVAAKYVEDKTEPKEPLPSNSSKNVGRNSFKQSRVAVATRFQHAFVQLLYNAQFEELSAWDLTMTSALNSDYLLTLPIYVDWKKASESNAIIFRRGYTTERQKGLLIVEKLDYLQSKFLQGFFLIIARPLRKIGNWMSEAFESASQGQDAQVWTKRIKLWLKELSLFQQADTYSEQTSDNLLGVDQLSDSDLPIWLAAQRAVTRYEGILSPVGPRGQLLRKLLIWIGLVSSTPKPPFHLDFDPTTYESYLRSAILLDAIAITALIVYVTRVALGYKQTWDRYQLLVNRTLYEKTLASGFGSVHFLLDASEQQQYKETILAYAILLKVENDQVFKMERKKRNELGEHSWVWDCK